MLTKKKNLCLIFMTFIVFNVKIMIYLKYNSDNSKFFDSKELSKKKFYASKNLTRRRFIERTLIGSAGLIVGKIALPGLPVQTKKAVPSDKIVLDFRGLGSRNCFLMDEFIKQGAEVAYVCVDTRLYENGLNASKQQSRKLKTVQDFRRILDDKEVTGMVITPGSHWGPLGTTLSCQAGKYKDSKRDLIIK